MSRSSSSWSRTAVVTAVLLLGACAAPRSGPPASARVEVLATGYLVDNTILATPEELRAFLADMNARDVTLYTTKDIPLDRVDRAAAAVRSGGATVEIVVGPPVPAR